MTETESACSGNISLFHPCISAPVDSKYNLVCTGCGGVYSDDRLKCDSDNALLRTNYRNKRLNLKNVRGMGRFHDWLPVQEIITSDSGPVAYKSTELATELGGDAGRDQLFPIASQAGAAEGHGVAELDARLEQVGSQAEDLDDLRDSAFFFDLGIMPLILFLDEAGGLALLNHLDPGHALLLAQPPTIELASTVKLVDKAAFFDLFDEAEIDKILDLGLGCLGIQSCLDLQCVFQPLKCRKGILH